MKRFTFAFYFEPRDLWVGVYWNTHPKEVDAQFRVLDVFVCLIPTLVLKLMIVPKSVLLVDAVRRRLDTAEPRP